MPRSAPRRPSPIALPNCPMDTLWEVDESSPDLQLTHTFQPVSRASSWFGSPSSAGPLRSIFEDDDDEEDLCFPLPPRSLPPAFSKKMTLPIQPVPQSRRTPSPTHSLVPSPRSSSLYAPRRAPVAAPPPRARVPSPATPATPPRRHRAEVPRSVSPTSSTSSSDTEPPRTPPAASSSLPCTAEKRVRALPPTEWESAIDALYAFDSSDDEDQQPSYVPPRSTKRSSIVAAPPPVPTRPPPSPPRSRTRSRSPDDSESYLSWSPVSSPTHLPMSPLFGRALNSPGFMPTSPTSSSDHGHSFSRPPRSSRRIVPERSMIAVESIFSM